jgi:FMN phosphatase YigB (HAD superfamily)
MERAYHAVLFDLDGTLLDNHMEAFLPHYFRRLATRVAHIMPPDQFIAHLLRGSDAMVANDGSITNEEAFAAVFFPLNGHSRSELEPLFMDFYARDFPELRRYTRRKPEARSVVQAAFDLECDVVIATNPLFPATAVEQRLEWAGVSDFDYRLVTSYENSRACKPNLLYFQHILQAIDQPAESCLVVGDENMDMVAAHLGCSTYLVPGPATQLASSTPEPTYSGPLAGVPAILRKQ